MMMGSGSAGLPARSSDADRRRGLNLANSWRLVMRERS